MPEDQQFDTADILALFPNPTPLGEGAQKTVFSVDHPDLGAIVLKIGKAGATGRLQRIRREVAALRDISSSYFPTLFEFQVLEDTRFYILEQRVDGLPLSARLEDFSEPAKALSFTVHLVRGLSELWSRRIVHRDIKPANILVGHTEIPTIIDLGLVRYLDAPSLTNSLAYFGPCTPNYAAPEQLRNEKRFIDHRSDQFGLGIVFGQLLLAGLHPFSREALGGVHGEIVENILAGQWARERLERYFAPSLPILERMLGPNPFQRYRTDEELLLALQEAME